MIPIKTKALKIILFFIVFFCIGACNDKEKKEILYKKPLEEKLDASCAWFRDEKNFFEPNYESKFYNYYNHKIKTKDYLSATKALKAVASNAMRFQSYSNSFYDTIVYFSDHFRNKVPEKKLTFLNLYLGKYYADKSDFTTAITYYSKGTLSEVTDYETCYSKAINFRNIAWCYYCLGKQDLALENNIKALDLLNKTERIDLLGGIYSNLYAINLATKEYDKAEENLNKALFYFKTNEEKNKTNIFICLYNKIQLYDSQENYKKRNPLIDSTLLAFKKLKMNDPSLKISIYLLKIKKNLDENKIEEAETILDEIKPEVDNLNSEYTSADYNTALAILEIKKNKGIKNTKIILDAIPLLIENKDFQNVKKSYSILHDSAIEKKEYEKALDYYIEYQKALDSLGNKETRNKIAEIETKYETEKKEQQIVLQKTAITNKNITIAFLLSAIVGILLIVLALTLRQKQKKLKQEKKVAQQYTKQLLEKTEEERKRIASDLHDSVSHELLSLKNSFEEKTEDTNKKIDAIINDIRIISRNLHPIMFDKVGLKSSIEQLVERAQAVNHFMVTAEIDYSNTLTSAKELQVYRIVQEALSNIIKYSDALAAKITIVEKRDILSIEIKDNGKGFNVTETLNNTTAFGLHNIIERTRVIGGEAKIISDKNGTIITLEIKK